MFLYVVLGFIFCFELFSLRQNLKSKNHLLKLEHGSYDNNAMQENLPKVSVVVTALNEEEHIESALQNMLQLDYPNFEIIAINDRSTDSTPDILNRLAQQDGRIKVLHIDKLPEGWLGKNHALSCGAKQAQGDFILFTDADVKMQSHVLSQTVQMMLQDGLDHLALIFKPEMPTSLLNLMAIDNLASLLQVFQPWRAHDPKARSYVGVGAYNLVRKKAYEVVSGHDSIALCPIDDILLGRILKESGAKQRCVNGASVLSVPWYSSIKDMSNGLLKNTFAAFDYRVEYVILVSVLIVMSQILPFLGIFIFDGAARLICIFICMVTVYSAYTIASIFSMQKRAMLLWTFAVPYLKLIILWRATFHTIKNQGIEWRGTFYSLDLLKANAVPIRPWKSIDK